MLYIREGCPTVYINTTVSCFLCNIVLLYLLHNKSKAVIQMLQVTYRTCVKTLQKVLYLNSFRTNKNHTGVCIWSNPNYSEHTWISILFNPCLQTEWIRVNPSSNSFKLYKSLQKIYFQRYIPIFQSFSIRQCNSNESTIRFT